MGSFLVLLLVIAAFILAYLLKRIRNLESSLALSVQAHQEELRKLETHLSQQDKAIEELKQTAITAPIPAPAQESTEPQASAREPVPGIATQPQPEPSPADYIYIPTTSLNSSTTPTIPPTPPNPWPAAEEAATPPPLPPKPPSPPLPEAAPESESIPQPEPAHTQSLEERLGANWLNKLGIVILVIGLALFLAVRLKTMSPAGKVLTGLTISLGILAGGLWLERKPPYRIFARATIGGGWALLFFTTFAMHHLAAARVIESLGLDLFLMLIVATGMVLHSLRYRSQTVTGLAFLLGYATVATSHFEAANGTVTFSLFASAILALGLVIVTTRRHWAWLELAGLIGILANHFLWLALVLPHATIPNTTGGNGVFALFAPSTALILFYYALFRAAYLLRKPHTPEEDRISSLSAILLAAGILALLKYQPHHPEWAFRALLAMGVLELALGLWSRPRRRNAFAVLTTIGIMLIAAAIPFQFHGISWPILWIVQAHVLALCAVRLGEPIFRRLGLITGFAASIVLAVHDVLPIIFLRASSTDLSQHPQLAIALALAAILFWLHAELYPRRWPEVHSQLGDAESLALKITSWLGLASAATALWIALPTTSAQWTAPAWLTLVILLGLAADWKNIPTLALQSDVLTGASLIALLSWDFSSSSQSVYLLPTSIAIALLYAGMRRRTGLEGSAAYVAPAYSWIATLLLLGTIARQTPDNWLSVAWSIPTILLFELGRLFRKSYLRWQGLASALCVAYMLFTNWFWTVAEGGPVHAWLSTNRSASLSLVIFAALAYWIRERTRIKTPVSTPARIESHAGLTLATLATLAIAAWLPVLAPTWGQAQAEPILWALLASALLFVAFAAHRRLFQVLATLTALLPACYTAYLLVVNHDSAAHSQPWWQSALFRMALSAAILLAALPIAFRLRQPRPESDSSSWTNVPKALMHPEQWFFFVPYATMTATLAVELRSGSITLGWSVLALAAFITGLLIGERSFRLSGLALLLLSVVKILLMDIWTLSQTDRYITLIGMGCALLAVSFLYTRFRQTFRRLL